VWPSPPLVLSLSLFPLSSSPPHTQPSRKGWWRTSRSKHAPHVSAPQSTPVDWTSGWSGAATLFSLPSRISFSAVRERKRKKKKKEKNSTASVN
jgi:hypothetical protein